MICANKFMLLIWQSNTKSSILLMSNNGLMFFKVGPVAQLGERCPCKAEAPGSNPGGSIIFYEYF